MRIGFSSVPMPPDVSASALVAGGAAFINASWGRDADTPVSRPVSSAAPDGTAGAAGEGSLRTNARRGAWYGAPGSKKILRMRASSRSRTAASGVTASRRSRSAFFATSRDRAPEEPAQRWAGRMTSAGKRAEGHAITRSAGPMSRARSAPTGSASRTSRCTAAAPTRRGRVTSQISDP